MPKRSTAEPGAAASSSERASSNLEMRDRTSARSASSRRASSAVALEPAEAPKSKKSKALSADAAAAKASNGVKKTDAKKASGKKAGVKKTAAKAADARAYAAAVAPAEPPPLLSVSRRTRRTPLADRVAAAGAKAYTVYNHMLLPTVFESMEADYWHLKQHVQVWDVACERQVEIRGPDSARLMQMLTPRDLRATLPGRCAYIPTVDETGGMLNDPVAVKLSEDRYWVSIADSDLLLWIKGVAYGFRLDVDVIEPDVSPLAVQGPKAEDLMALVFGEEIRSVRFFRYGWFEFEGRSFVIARSGYSKQGGFEIYVEGADYAPPLWDALMAAGEPLEVRAGGPNLIERIEGGLLSYGNDMTRSDTPFECGLGRYCNVETAIGFVGRDALLRQSFEGPTRRIRGLRIEGDPAPPCVAPWPILSERGDRVGGVTSAIWSPDLETNVAMGMVAASHWASGQPVWVSAPDGERAAVVVDLPHAPPSPGSASVSAATARNGTNAKAKVKGARARAAGTKAGKAKAAR